MVIDEKAVFVAALEYSDANAREAYLEDACSGRPEMLNRLHVLLAAHAQPAGPLDHGALAVREAPCEGPGMVIGPYKLMEEIGAGGFGLVFVAEQLQPVRRKVAVKVIKPGMDTREVIARFEAERQALAMMDHPNIARVFDGGATPSGRPYFVMELVKGMPITEFCDRHQVPLRERLRLFIDVCQATQHAHQKGVVHRDLKPANIIVSLHDATPVVKVIDFGVAKAIGQSLTEKTVYTGFTRMIGTPAYMSPEQAGMSDLDIDTRSDIYSLGVLLYELLTGTTPFEKDRLKGAGYDEIRRIIREEEPPRPSLRLSQTLSAGHAGQSTKSDAPEGPEPQRFALRVPRFDELDWVVMKCLEKDRNRRYETATELARDIERYVEDEPVHACPPSKLYRLRKFVRRNKGTVLSATAIFLLLIGGIAGTTWGLVRAENARAAEAIEREAAVKAKEAETAERVRAEGALKKAAREAAVAAAINDFLNKDLLQLASPMGQANEGVTPDANLRLRTVLQRAAKRIDGKFPDEPEVEMQLRNTIGAALFRVNDWSGALAQYQKVVPYFQETLGSDHPRTLTAVFRMAKIHRNLNQFDLAVPLLEQNLERRKILNGPHHAETLDVMDALVGAYRFSRQEEKALKLALESWELRKRHFGADHAETLVSMNNVASVYLQQEQVAKALPLFEEALNAMRIKLAPLHPEQLNTRRNLAHAYHVAEQFDKSVPLQEAVVEDFKTVYGLGDTVTQGCIDLLLVAYLDLGRCDKATALLPFITTLGGEASPQNKETLEKRVQGLRDRIAAIKPSADKYQQKLAEKKADHPDTLAARHAFALVLRSKYRTSAAAYHLKAVLEARQKSAGADDLNTQVCRLELGMTRLLQKKYAEAEPLLLEAYAGLKKNPGDVNGRWTAIALVRLVRLYDNSNQRDKADEWRKQLEDFKKR